jgi:hypothetical protein
LSSERFTPPNVRFSKPAVSLIGPEVGQAEKGVTDGDYLVDSGLDRVGARRCCPQLFTRRNAPQNI